jgi:hypothetical protein
MEAEATWDGLSAFIQAAAVTDGDVGRDNERVSNEGEWPGEMACPPTCSGVPARSPMLKLVGPGTAKTKHSICKKKGMLCSGASDA